MKTAHLIRMLGLAGLGALAPSLGWAQDEPYFYGGLSLGQSRSKIDQARISNDLLGGGFTSSLSSRDEISAAYKLFGGYQLNRYFGLEAGYFNLGKFSFGADTVPAGTLDGRMRIRGLNFDLVGTLPIGDNFGLTGRVGAQRAKTQDHFTGTGAVTVVNPDPNKSESNIKLGVGMQYAFTPNLIVRAEAERYRINDAVGHHGNVNAFLVSLVVPFGRAARPRPVTMTMAPPPPMAEPAPPPMAVVTPPPPPPPVIVPPARRRVSFSAESLFGFDKSTLRPEGMAALDTFVRELDGTQFDTITVEGHTDRLGSDTYNQKLSTQRAGAVKDYLVGSGKLDSAKITVIGKGETMPVTRPGDCKGNSPSKALITCLQPDRRVEIEVVGSR